MSEKRLMTITLQEFIWASVLQHGTDTLQMTCNKGLDGYEGHKELHTWLSVKMGCNWGWVGQRIGWLNLNMKKLHKMLKPTQNRLIKWGLSCAILNSTVSDNHAWLVCISRQRTINKLTLLCTRWNVLILLPIWHLNVSGDTKSTNIFFYKTLSTKEAKLLICLM